MKRLASILATVGIVLLLARACQPVFDAIDSAPLCCCLAVVAGLLVCVYAACYINGDIDDWYERHCGERRS